MSLEGAAEKRPEKGHELNRPARVSCRSERLPAILLFERTLPTNVLQCMYDSTSHNTLFCLEASIAWCWNNNFFISILFKRNLVSFHNGIKWLRLFKTTSKMYSWGLHFLCYKLELVIF